MALTPFDYIKSISEKSGYIYDELDEKNYNAHVINIGLSFFPDTIHLINEANKYGLAGKMHYDFLYNLVEPRKRYSKWLKKTAKEEDVENIMEFFDVTMVKAKELLRALPKNKILEIKQKLKKGG